ncbi:MAG TPA: cyclic nucleotide-binding domain-containing protein [Stellaceae bacterium]|nr:cyclic nucleotide-binding domain-containing protein [Stellaceae bacterium]
MSAFKIVIIGSGPAGLSAAAHAARLGVPHLLLERAPHLTDTIFKYQKRKHVMAAPGFLPLRSDMPFQKGPREEVIDGWESTAKTGSVNFRLNVEVTRIEGERGAFTVTLADGETIAAEFVVLAIGVQGNLNKLRVTGADLPCVQYQLDDPDEYSGEEIVVIGTGDAGIENALALAANNRVSIVNRVTDFPRAKPANAELIEAAIGKGDIEHLVNCEPRLIEPGFLTVETADGAARIACDRIIARIGALPPRRFVEACGIAFPNDSPSAFPVLSDTYESSVPGLYVIGALAGHPLIKHCLNEGYEVVEYILGNAIAPADEPLIQAKIERAGVHLSVSDLISSIQQKVPLFHSLTTAQIREFMIHSELHAPKSGDVVVRRGEYSNSLFAVLDGEVGIQTDLDDPTQLVRLGAGEFFGEMALISGRRRNNTIVATASSLLLEVGRTFMVRLVRSELKVRQAIDDAAVARQISSFLGTHVPISLMSEVIATTLVLEFKPNESLIDEGALDDAVFLIRRGSVTVSVRLGGRDVVLAYLPAGNYVGEMALVTRRARMATVRAVVATEAIRIDGRAFRTLLEHDARLRHAVDEKLGKRLAELQKVRMHARESSAVEFFMRHGLGEATDVLVIDESLCVRCDNCEKACAELHQGISRLNREAGPTFDMLHLPTSCRHCEDPHCMKECPPDAIHRAPNGEVWIDDQCIGCGNCERNCPYGVIHMAAEPPKKPGLLQWLLFGRGSGPGEDKSPEGYAKRTGAKHAVKCDMCKDIAGGPACVRACPTGAAIRVDPVNIMDAIRRGR